MSLPLIDFRGKITPETDAVLDVFIDEALSPAAKAVIATRAIAFRKSRVEVVSELIEEWAAAKVEMGRVLNQELESRTDPAVASAKLKKIPRRRKEIFVNSMGMCHYCGCKLTLAGKWHIDHKMPKALMGTDDDANLVASCVPCNLKKRDRTDIEFIRSRND